MRGRGKTTRWMGIVCGMGLTLGAAQAMILDNAVAQTQPVQTQTAQAQAAPAAAPQTPGFQVVAGHAFTPDKLPADVKVEQDVVQLAPGGCTGFHEHGGPGIETVISGTVTVETRGQTQIQTFKAGEAYTYPAGAVHEFCNPAATPATYTAVFLLLNGADVVTPR